MFSQSFLDDKLLIGTKQGHLITYSVTPGYGGVEHDLKLTRYCKTFSKKPITQLAVVPFYELVIKLSDNIVSIHDLSDLNCPLLHTLNKTKGATLFALDNKVMFVLKMIFLLPNNCFCQLMFLCLI